MTDRLNGSVRIVLYLRHLRLLRRLPIITASDPSGAVSANPAIATVFYYSVIFVTMFAEVFLDWGMKISS
jgi:hypothetical protein